MKRNSTYKYLLVSIISLLVLFGCTNEKSRKDVSIIVNGPYTQGKVLERFDLDSLPLNVDSKNLFLATVSNNGQDTIYIRSTNEHRVFPDSTWHRSYAPYSAIRKSWSIMLYEKDSNELELIEVPRSKSKTFWFSGYYDDYIDSLSIYFSGLRNQKMQTAVVNKLYDNKTKPYTNYELIETEDAKDFDIDVGVETQILGPLTYNETNQKLGTTIEYNIDSEEVFIFRITNKRKENLYLEVWENSEINIDTLYSFSPFTLTSKDYGWNENSNKKGALPIDTIQIKPQESHMFWDSYNMIWPTTDSIAFNLRFRTDEYLISGLKKYKVKKY
jgi:hypothetical protein